MKQHRYTVGLTGGIGSGKSTVAQAFKDLDVQVIDADQASRAVVEPGTQALDTIYQHFSKAAPGKDILMADGQLNRAALRAIIFSDLKQKDWLEELLHPLIRAWISKQLQAATKHPYCILESPLLLETDQHLMVNGVLLVDVPCELQLERACHRDAKPVEEIQAIINSQMNRHEKRRRADWIFDNSQPMDSIASRVLELHQTFLKQAELIL